MNLNISKELLDRIRDHGRSSYPYECCGLLLGRSNAEERSVVDLRPVENARDESRETRYVISPEDLLNGEKDARRAGLDVMGIYHSHPDHPARPSEYDRNHAFPWYSYIIVNVAHGVPGDLTSWVLREDRSAFDQEELVSD